jgi:heme exporter protein C
MDREHWLGILGLTLLVVGSCIGLLIAPPEKFMGDVGRILYIHVPTAWNALIISTAAFVIAIGSLTKRKPNWDAALHGTLMTTALYTVMLLIQGSIWAKPTWGVYWDWDPRLTTSAIMGVSFAGILALRASLDDPERRASWTAVATIIAYVDVPIVYMSIEWWRTLHQEFSTPETVDAMMVIPLRINAFALLFIGIWLSIRGARLSKLERGAAVPVAPESSEPLVAGRAG